MSVGQSASKESVGVAEEGVAHDPVVILKACVQNVKFSLFVTPQAASCELIALIDSGLVRSGVSVMHSTSREQKESCNLHGGHVNATNEPQFEYFHVI